MDKSPVDHFLENKGYFVTHHLFQIFFSLILVLVSSLTTAFFLTRGESFTSKYLPTSVAQVIKSSTMLPPNSGTDYIERDSPFDNRSVGLSSPSAQVIFHGPRNSKKIALTFDAEMTDGMKANLISKRVNSSYDKRIVDTLNATHTKATLFLTGMWIELYPDVTSELAKNPLFELGSHSYSDTSYDGFCYGLTQIESTIKIEEIGATEKLLREHAGLDNRLFRFPGGCYTPSDVMLVNQANDTVVHWDVKGNDGFNNNTNQVVHNIVDNVQNGSIILLHMNGAPTAPKTAEALPEIIATLKSRGFEFVKVSELLGLK